MVDDRRILLVEDNPDDADLTLRAFARIALRDRVDVVTDGIEAIERLCGPADAAGHARAPMPAVVLLDLKLPKMEGTEVLRRLRAHPRTALTPVVVITSSNDRQDVDACYRAGANSYLRKPVDFDAFGEAVRQLAAWWLVLNETPSSTP